MWLDYQMKDDEIYTNSIDFIYCVKCFVIERKLEVWSRQKGYYLISPNDSSMYQLLDEIKMKNDREMQNFILREMKEIEV